MGEARGVAGENKVANLSMSAPSETLEPRGRDGLGDSCNEVIGDAMVLYRIFLSGLFYRLMGR